MDGPIGFLTRFAAVRLFAVRTLDHRALLQTGRTQLNQS